MPKVFISYARQDLNMVERLEHRLVERGYSVWRDQENIYGGKNWPKAIGEAILEHDYVLLVWSKHAAQAHFVEFEWSTALALRKSIVPYIIDDTPLPPSLSAFNSIQQTNVGDDLKKILKAFQVSEPEPAPQQSSEVIEKLSELNSTEPEEAVQTVQNIIRQRASNVHGPVYQAGRDVIITVPEDKRKTKKSWIETTQAKLMLVATTLGIIVTIFALINAFNKAAPSSRFQTIVVDKHSNIGIPDVTVNLLEVDGKRANQTVTTAPDGRFVIKVAAEAGTKIRLSFEHPEYQPYNNYYQTENPKKIRLERKTK